ncbi:MAG TPA: chemotaxis protein CheD [Vicinamibacterales bacterium]
MNEPLQLPVAWCDQADAVSRVVIGIGELAVSNDPGSRITTHAVGSCIAVCAYDPVAAVAGMLHFLLPEASINPDRASAHPAAFADTGIPLLFQRAYAHGLVKQRAIVKLVGGADMAPATGAFNTGARNLLAARNLLWRNGVLIAAEDVGGTDARTVHMSVRDGRLQVISGRSHKDL